MFKIFNVFRSDICLAIFLLFIGIQIVMNCFSVFAKEEHILPNNLKAGDRYVRIENDYGFVSFKDCRYLFEKSSCKQIGPREVYSEQELTSQHLTEKSQVVLSAAGLVIAATAGFGTFGIVGHAFSGTIELITWAAGLSGSVTFVTIGSKYLDGLNLVKQDMQARVISPKVFNKENIYISNINEVVKQLNVVLSKLD